MIKIKEKENEWKRIIERDAAKSTPWCETVFSHHGCDSL